jgi:hypothetical protein
VEVLGTASSRSDYPTADGHPAPKSPVVDEADAQEYELAIPVEGRREGAAWMNIGERRRTIYIEPIEEPIEEPPSPEPSELPAQGEPEPVR